ncbi:MAG: hypothetical protein GTO24_00085 [candidate division Zixibacteria bacterium]|nr:hypothetical protein [candidate division Zixibacteria bacterium]
MKKPVLLPPLIIIAVVVTYLLIPHDVEKELEKRDIPVIKQYSEIIGLEKGGFFTHWFFVALQSDKGYIKRYEQQLIEDGAEAKEIGSARGQVLIIESKEIDPTELDTLLWNAEAELVLKEVLDSKYIKWWRVDKITDGALYRKQLPKMSGYKVYIDRGTSIIYVYWHYS